MDQYISIPVDRGPVHPVRLSLMMGLTVLLMLMHYAA